MSLDRPKLRVLYGCLDVEVTTALQVVGQVAGGESCFLLMSR